MSAKADAVDYETVKIPSELYRRLVARLSGSAFTSVDEWIVRLIQAEIEPSSLSKSAEDQITKRLKSLGYE